MTKLVITIDHLRQAGLSDETIRKVLMLKEAQANEKADAANRLRVARHRSRHRENKS